jgi:hypothetical protein
MKINQITTRNRGKEYKENWVKGKEGSGNAARTLRSEMARHAKAALLSLISFRRSCGGMQSVPTQEGGNVVTLR